MRSGDLTACSEACGELVEPPAEGIPFEREWEDPNWDNSAYLTTET
jgi:hypothetical protein